MLIKMMDLIREINFPGSDRKDASQDRSPVGKHFIPGTGSVEIKIEEFGLLENLNTKVE